MAKYRKKPVVIEAWPVVDIIASIDNVAVTLPVPVHTAVEEGVIEITRRCIFVKTLEGTHTGLRMDMLIMGVAGEFYPCKPDIFAATYEAADAN